MAWPAEPEDSVIYQERELISNSDLTLRMLQGKKADFWGDLYINGTPFGGAGTLDAKAYGAKGDGTTDDTVALQTWLNTSPTKAHYLPTGTYRVTGTLTIPYVQGFTLIGETKFYSIIEMDANNLPILRTEPSQQWHGHYHLENFRLRYKTAQLVSYTNSIALQLSGHPTEGNSFNYCVFRDLKIDNARVGLGVKRTPGLVQNPWNNLFERIDFGCTSYSLIDLRGDAAMGYPISRLTDITHLGYFEPILGTGPAIDITGEFIIDSLDVEDWAGTIISSIGECTASIRGVHIERHRIGASGLRFFDLYTGSYTIDQVTLDVETAVSGSTSYILWGDNTEWTIGSFGINTKTGTAGSNLAFMQPGAGGKVHMIGRTTYAGSANWAFPGFYWEGTHARLDTTTGSGAWDASSLAVGEMASTTITVYGARGGDAVVVAMDIDLPAGVQLTGNVTANDTVRVTLVNHSGTVFDPGVAWVKARIWKDF